MADTPLEDRPLSTNSSPTPSVRPAGPGAIACLPAKIVRQWDDVDQAMDESFPASDAPGQGVG